MQGHEAPVNATGPRTSRGMATARPRKVIQACRPNAPISVRQNTSGTAGKAISFPRIPVNPNTTTVAWSRNPAWERFTASIDADRPSPEPPRLGPRRPRRATRAQSIRTDGEGDPAS